MHSLVLAIDVSGSIGSAELSAFLGCIAEIVEQCKPRSLHVLWWDTNAIHEDITDFDVEDTTQLHPSGGGGTDYDCAIDMIEELGLDPDCVVCCTDGYIHVSKADVPWPHVTVTTGADMPFGKNVKLEL
jgi:predicted metal-dependent peptidase